MFEQTSFRHEKSIQYFLFINNDLCDKEQGPRTAKLVLFLVKIVKHEIV